MTNKRIIEIAQIKNLELIYFYTLESNSGMGLNIVYDNGKNLDYNYTYEYFSDFVAKVINIYKKEKDLKNIQFLNEESKEIIENFCLKEFVISKEENLCDYSKYNNRNIEVRFLFEYIKRTIFLFLKCMENKKDIKIISINGYRDKYSIEYMDPDIKRIPLIIIKKDLNNYIFKFSYIDDISLSFDGDITIYNDCICVKYTSLDKSLEGKNLYHIDNSNSEEIIKYCGSIVNYEEQKEEKNDKIVDFYLNLLNLPLMEKRIKTVDNNYLISGFIDNNTKYFIHLSISKDYINVIVDKRYGVFKDNIFVLIEQQKKVINMMLEKDNNLVIETHFLPTNISTGTYKKELENKYKYEIYEIDSDDLNKEFNIIKDKVKKIGD